MKKFISIVVTMFVVLALLVEMGGAEAISGNDSATKESEVSVEDISSKLIRFHVIANSDNEKDQALKLKVRDQVLEYIQPLLKDSDCIQESREILKRENGKILQIATQVIADNGYNYSVESTLDKEYFPIKTYGNITLPQGEYEAYRIIIGTGEGQNWWCVMFPPICFVDITRGEVAYEETEKEMKRVLDDKEFNMVDNTSSDESNNGVESNIKDSDKDKKSTQEDSEKNNKENSEENNKDKENIDDSGNIVDNSEDNNIVIEFKIVDILKNLFE